MWLVRVAVHVACWVPFVTTAVDSWRGPWRAVGDNARLALNSWNTLSGHIPLVGQPNELPHAPHDLGPLQYWLLTIPVHADTARGVLWGAVLLAMVAVSLAVEAGYAVRGELGGLLAGGFVIAMVTWFPGFANRPEDNPNFGLIYFLPTLAVCVAVLAGHRRWWPVLVVTASVAAQAHLMFAVASVGLVLVAAVTGLVDRFRARGGYGWLAAGLVAGAACWIAPLEQQVTSAAGRANMSLLLHAENGARHVGLGYALRAMASLAVPSSLWWQQNLDQQHDLYQRLGSGPVAAGAVVLAATAAGLVLAVRWLRSRELAGLAAIGLLTGLAATADFALIPVRGLANQQHDLVFVLFTAVLLAWLTVICVTTAAAVTLIRDRRRPAAAVAAEEQQTPGGQGRQPARRYPTAVRAAVALLLVTIVVLGAARHAANYAGAGTKSLHVSAALAIVERSLPQRQVIGLAIASPSRADRFQIQQGMCWALVANGYIPDARPTGRNRTIPEVTVLIRGLRLTVLIQQRTMRQLTRTGFNKPYSCGIEKLIPATPRPSSG
jgi:hypothetical protein